MEPITIITLVLFGLACGGAGFFLGINLGLWHERRRVTSHHTHLQVTLPPMFGEEFDEEADDDDESDYGPDSDFWKARRN